MRHFLRLTLVLAGLALLCQCADNPSRPTKSNHAPILEEIGPQAVRAGDTLRFDVTANDQDGTIPSLSAQNLPDHSSFTSAGDNKGRFMFVPDTGQVGTYSVLFYASDGELADSEIVSIISVTQANEHRPVLLPIAPQPCVTTIALSFMIMADDSDYIFPSVAAYDLPVNASFVPDNNGTGVFSFTPDSTQLGVFEPVFVASDGELADTESVRITVVPYRPSENWPLAVGNYWVYETCHYDTNITGIPTWWYLWDSTQVRIDSIYVRSGSQSGGIIRWLLSDGSYVGARNDSIFYGDGIVVPLVWPDRVDSVPAGRFYPTYERCTLHGLSPSFGDCLIFAKGVGIIERYSHALWNYDASCTVSRLVRYHIK